MTAKSRGVVTVKRWLSQQNRVVVNRHRFPQRPTVITGGSPSRCHSGLAFCWLLVVHGLTQIEDVAIDEDAGAGLFSGRRSSSGGRVRLRMRTS